VEKEHNKKDKNQVKK